MNTEAASPTVPTPAAVADGFIYKPKSNNRRRYGHRQDLSVLEITGITKGRSRAKAADKAEPADAEPNTAESNPAEED